jgi:hypothetical protein
MYPNSKFRNEIILPIMKVNRIANKTRVIYRALGSMSPRYLILNIDKRPVIPKNSGYINQGETFNKLNVEF